MGENYAELVKSVWPRVVFIKTKKRITKDNFNELRENAVYDHDTPEIKRDTLVFPLSMESYPSVLGSMTASQAGWWALKKCESERWRPTDENIRSCLANLEMDM